MKKNLFAKILIPILALGILIAPISPVFKVKSGKIALGITSNKIYAASAKDGFPRMGENNKEIITISDIQSTRATISIKILTGESESDPNTGVLTGELDYNYYNDVLNEKATEVGKNKADLTKEEMLDACELANYTSNDVFDTHIVMGTCVENWFFAKTSKETGKNITSLKDFELNSLTKEHNEFYNILAENAVEVYDEYGAYTELPDNGMNNGNLDAFKLILIDKSSGGQTYTFSLSTLGARFYILESGYNITFVPPTNILKPETEYTVQIKMGPDDSDQVRSEIESFKTLPAGNDTTDPTGTTSTTGTEENPLDLGCGITSWTAMKGCIAALLYLIWEIAGFVMHLAGNFLDFFLFYSINSSTYTSSFIEKGWGVIRDVANIFFIIALLYVAIKTILGLNVSNNKKLIGSIVVIALIINFSLFFTQVIIDSSNILSRVFYNQITTIGEDETVSTSGSSGEKSISGTLVTGFNPQSIVGDQSTYNKIGPSFFILITIIMIALTLYCAYMFFVIAILFIGRVVSLWICMIFSPFAFISYAVPVKQIPFQHEKWWKDLLESAFMAPIFIFFLYIIILFIELGKEAAKIAYQKADLISSPSTNDILAFLMGTIIPFAIIFIMLTRAKKLAVDFSGELGAGISKIGGFAAGGMVGLAAGVLAKGSRATVGRVGNAMANSDWAKKWEAKGFGGGAARSLFKAAGKGSFDVRGVKIAGKSLSSTGLKGMDTFGKAQEGGYEKYRKDKVEKRQKRAQELEVGENSKLKQAVNKTERDLQELLKDNTQDIERLDRAIAKAKEINDPAQIEAAKNNKTAFMQTLTVAQGVNAGKNADDLAKQAAVQKSGILQENRNRKWKFASHRWGAGSKEAKHKIRMEDKLDSGGKH